MDTSASSQMKYWNRFNLPSDTTEKKNRKSVKQQFSREWTSDNNGSEPCETENSQGELCDCPSSLP